MTTNNLPEIGEKIIVHNIKYAEAKVSDLIWNPSESRIVIELSWNDSNGKFLGKSKVYPYDENKVWYRKIKNN